MPTRKAKPSVPTADEVPVTRAMLAGTRTELKADISGVDHKIDALGHRIDALDRKIDAVRDELKVDIHDVKESVARVEARLDGMEASMARMAVLMEGQDARNKVVLDGLMSSFSRHDQAERRLDRLEDTVRSLAAARPAG